MSHITLKEKVLEAIKGKLDTGISSNQLATQIGINPATLHNIKNNRDELISDSMWNKLATFFGITKNDWKTIFTTNAKTINALCADTQINSRFIAIAGYTGAGKTTALKYYADKNASNTFYVLCNVLMGRKEFLKAIQKSIGISIEGSLIYQMQGIIDRLSGMDVPLLILDDAGKLNDGNMKLIQLIYDELQGQCGLIMAGTDDMKRYIDKMAAKGKMGFPELKSRIAYWQRMYSTKPQEVAEISKANGITDEEAIKYLTRQKSANYRDLRNAITMAKLSAAGGAVNFNIVSAIKTGDTEFTTN